MNLWYFSTRVYCWLAQFRVSPLQRGVLICVASGDRTVTMIQEDTVPPMGLLLQLGAMKPSFSLLIPSQDPKSYTELNTKTTLDWGAEILC